MDTRAGGPRRLWGRGRDMKRKGGRALRELWEEVDFVS